MQSKDVPVPASEPLEHVGGRAASVGLGTGAPSRVLLHFRGCVGLEVLPLVPTQYTLGRSTLKPR